MPDLIKTLRHYDKLGIIKPAYVDPINKYRYYSKGQLPFIAHVKEMRFKGFSLGEIQGCFDKEENVFKWDKAVALADEKLDQIDKQLERLLKVRRQFITWKEMYIETGVLKSAQPENVKVMSLSPRTVAYIRSRIKFDSHLMQVMVIDLIQLLHEHNLYHQGPVMSIFYDDYRHFDYIGADFEVCWEVLADRPLKYSFLREITAGIFASLVHRGDYGSLYNEAYPRLYNWLKEHDYQVTGPAIQRYILSVNNSHSPEKYITELQVPITK